MSNQFEQLIPFILGYEGVNNINPTGYVNNPSDPGGETKWGISQKAWTKWRWGQAKYSDYSLYVKDLTKAQAIVIYQNECYPSVCDTLPPGPALVIFDSEVNEGMGVKILQRALGVTDDGVVGSATTLQIRLAIRDVPKLIENLLWERVKHYAKGNPVFIRGWLDRVVEVRVDALRL